MIIVTALIVAGGSITSILIGSALGTILCGLILAGLGGFLIIRFKFSPSSLIVGLVLLLVGLLSIREGV